jgi:hypothetical protein
MQVPSYLLQSFLGCRTGKEKHRGVPELKQLKVSMGYGS